MKTKLILFLLCFASLNVMGFMGNTLAGNVQGIVSRDKCKTCGKAISQCQYKGKHPKEKICSTCGIVLSKCKYKGKHPDPESDGYHVHFFCYIDCISANFFVDGKPERSHHYEIDDMPEKNFRHDVVSFLKTGNHTIRVIANGYEEYSRRITVNRQNTSFHIKLNKKLEPVNSVITTSGTLNGHEWVDLGLSVKWATCNVGASSPSDYGGYYAWGETSTKSRYDWSNCFDSLDSTGDSWGTYKLGGQTRITPTSGHDTARENWGSTWRMPTDAENEELCKKCKWTWTSKNGHNGYVVTGPNGNSIFLPAAGYPDGTDSYIVGSYGYYWSSTLSSSSSNGARGLYFDSSDHDTDCIYNRSYGQSVRPVTD